MSNITHKEALNKMVGIDNIFRKIIEQKSLNLNQIKLANIYFMVSEIFTGKTKKFIENNEGEFYVFEPKYDDEKESNIARQRSAEQPNEQQDTTDMPDLESEESAA